MATVVVGGGIVGLTTAYYLTRKGHKVQLVEKCAVACHSSGKAGGFLTDGDSGWHQGPIAKLAKHSFALHEELAQQFGADAIGYRRVKCLGHGAGKDAPPSWLNREFNCDMGGQGGLAQVSPKKLMAALEAAVRSEGCVIVIGKVVGVDVKDEEVTAVKVEQAGQVSTFACAAVVFGMGPWARDAAEWFPDSCMPKNTVSNRYTSVIWDDVEVGKDATMVFVSKEHHVEIYPRADECYANGCPTTTELPDDPMEIEPPAQTIEDVKAETLSAVEHLRHAKVLRTTACFLAGSDDGLPVVGLVPKTKNAVIACGGGCWGILTGPAMGQAAAALVLREEPAVNLKPFDPSRFDRANSGMRSGLPPKLQALLDQNPQMADMLQQNPEQVMALLQMFQDEEG